MINISIKQLNQLLDNQSELSELSENKYKVYGWVRTVRSSSSTLGFCTLNDGSDVNGLQIVISTEFMEEEILADFFKIVNTGSFITCTGNVIKSPAKGQKYEMQLLNYSLHGIAMEGYPLAKSKMNLETLREHIHLRGRTNTFGSVFRIRSTLTKIIHDFYHDLGFLHLDPNIITTNECEGGAGVFLVTENDISKPCTLKMLPDKVSYDWCSDHFNQPVFLTVSSQLQLEALASSLGNVYTMNKSFRSEHSCTTKHASEFTHLEIEMIHINLADLINISEKMIKYSISEIFKRSGEDIENLDKFVSKGLIEKLKHLQCCEYKKMTHSDIVNEINEDIKKDSTLQLPILGLDDDLGSVHENYITKKYNCPIFLTHWPFAIKSFYMKKSDDGKHCESFDLLMPYGVGELIGASMREDDLDKLYDSMKEKGVNVKGLEFYLDLRKYGSCPHGGFGLGFDRLVMLISGIQNIRDVVPFPVNYKSCKY